ncbi:MAG TPA: nucleotidyl transferase AbiEii/AbiGii toxin family protein, partial [Chitinophagaceae bacterium]|nr:nucleotidyl transferase AbiEii/AbiGii toxin family protein [Chitinophagaceae bacterium]
VSPQIYSLISEIQTFQSVATFSLAGGTSLALRYNHRVSEDIDFFSDNIVGVNGLILIKQQLQKKYKDDLLFCELINEESGDQFCF